jgi:signal transduction histidine kinase
MTFLGVTSLGASIIILFIGIFVLAKNRTNLLNQSFFLYFLSLGTWMLGIYGVLTAVDKASALSWVRILDVGVVFIPTSFYLFTLTFLGEKKLAQKIAVPYIVSFLALLTIFDHLFTSGVTGLKYGYVASPGAIFLPFMIFMIGLVIYGHYKLLDAYGTSDGHKKSQIRYFFGGTLTLTIGGLMVVPAIFGSELFGGFPVWNFTNILYGIILAYAIVRHRLMDIEFVIKRSFIYSTLTALIVGLYSLVIFIAQVLFGNIAGLHWLFAFVGAGLIAVGFKPLETAFTQFTDNYFFKAKYDYHRTLIELSRAMSELTSLDRLTKLTTRIVMMNVKIEGAMLFVYDSNKDIYYAITAQGNMKEFMGRELSRSEDLVKFIDEKRDLLLKDDIIFELGQNKVPDPQKKFLQSVLTQMNALKAALAVPSKVGGFLIGFMFLSEKRSQDPYSMEDLLLFQTIAPEAAIAIKNAMTYDEIRKNLEKEHEKVESVEKQLERTERLASLGTLVAGVAHEIRNPMQALRMKAEGIQEKADNAGYVKEAGDSIVKNADRILAITKEMLDMSKVKEPEKKPVDLNGAVESVLQLLQVKNNIKLVKELNPVPAVNGSANQLSQVFINLFQNAVKAMPDGGLLTVRTFKEGDLVSLEVADTGIGIPKENLGKIFDPFFTTNADSTGLGLSISDRIVREHGGLIKVKTETGKGSVFTVVLPSAKIL